MSWTDQGCALSASLFRARRFRADTDRAGSTFVHVTHRTGQEDDLLRPLTG